MSAAHLARTLANWRRLRIAREHDAVPLPMLDLVALRVTELTLPLVTKEDRLVAYVLVAETIGRQGAQGWARCRSELLWPGMADPPDYETAGPPIAGDWRVDHASSTRLTPHPERGMAALLRTFSERSLAEGEEPADDETACLRQRATVLAHDRLGESVLVHHVFWGADRSEPWHNLRRLCDRFVGFSKD